MEQEIKLILFVNLKMIRRKWGLDQTQFAKLMEVTRGSVTQYETGNNIPKIFFLLKLENYCGIPIRGLCLRHLDLAEIPDQPHSIPDHQNPETMEGSTNPSYNQELEKRVSELENKFNELKNK